MAEFEDEYWGGYYPQRNALGGTSPSDYTTSDVLARWPLPYPLDDAKGSLSGFLRRQGKVPPPEWETPTPKPEPNILSRMLQSIPPEAMFAANFVAPNVRLPVPRTPNPKAFMAEVQGREIPATAGIALRWNPEQEWLDILRRNEPVGRTFVTPVNARTGYTYNPDAFILGPKVDDAFRRQGIGTATYDALAGLGAQHSMRMVPGMDLSRAAFNLWRKRDPELLRAALSREGAHARLTPDDQAWLASQPPRVFDPIKAYHGSPHDFDKFMRKYGIAAPLAAPAMYNALAGDEQDPR